jgi:hypothetical protein
MIEFAWIGIFISLLHSAMFSGLNLGFFGLSRLRLEVSAETGDEDARRVLYLRKDAHFLLTTVLWGNVASNVALTLFTDSLMTGISAFIFSTFGITFFGEIFPQAYFSRHALRASVFLFPIVRFYQFLLYPVAKPTALLLDFLLGKERISYFKEKEFIAMLQKHSGSEMSDLERLETMGAMNFLAIDDIKVKDEGEIVNPKSIISLPVTDSGLPVFPDFERDPRDPFLQKLHESNEKWVIITDASKDPKLVLNADQFLRDVMYEREARSVYTYCHRPILVKDSKTLLGEVILKFKVQAQHAEDDVVDNDLILYWGKQKRILTGADILGRLLRGIVKRAKMENVQANQPDQ